MPPVRVILNTESFQVRYQEIHERLIRDGVPPDEAGPLASLAALLGDTVEIIHPVAGNSVAEQTA